MTRLKRWESGIRADLIAIDCDPFADMRSLTGRVVWVMQDEDGAVVHCGDIDAGGQG